MIVDHRTLATVLRQDLASFIQKCFYTVSPGDPFIANWHTRVMAWHLSQVARGEIKRLIITLPPRQLKSICASVAFPAWILGHDPTRRIICASYSQELSKKHALDCRSVIWSDWYQQLFPKMRLHPKHNTELELLTTQMGGRLATSVSGTLTGRGGNLIVIDDPIKPQDATSTAEREKVRDWYDGTLYSRLNNKKDDAIVVVMQRIHVDDLVGHLLENKEENWVELKIPAIAEQEERYDIAPQRYYPRAKGSVLDPVREPLDRLRAVQRQLGTQNFSAQYQQAPVYHGGNLVKIGWFQMYKDRPPSTFFDCIVQSWDTATKAAEINDYSVCTTWGVKAQKSYLLDVFRQRLEYPALKRRVLQEAKKHGADAVFIEDAGSGQQLIQDFEAGGILWPLHAAPKGDKVTRMQGQSAKIEAGDVLLPETAPWRHDFLTEVSAFPVGRHDDQVDSMCQFLARRPQILHRLAYDKRVNAHKQRLMAMEVAT